MRAIAPPTAITIMMKTMMIITPVDEADRELAVASAVSFPRVLLS